MSQAIVEMKRRMPYAPHELSALVADIRSYPRFIPWLGRLDVLAQKQDGDVLISIARAEVGWKAIKEDFTTEVRAGADEVSVTLVSGPFKSLENRWRFHPDPGGCLVEFFVGFEFRSAVLQTIARVNRDLVSARIMAAFEGEAKRRFAPSSRRTER